MKVFALLLLLAPPGDDLDRHVSQLSHRSFRVRSQARQSLHRLGWPAVERLRKSAAGARDIEVKRALEGVVAQLEAERRSHVQRTIQERYGADLPMIDALWLNPRTASYEWDDAAAPRDLKQALRLAWRRRLIDYLHEANLRVEGGDPRRWASYRTATHYWFTELLEADVPVWLVDGLFVWMRWRDNVWLRSIRTEPDPLHWPGWQTPPACPRAPLVMPPAS